MTKLHSNTPSPAPKKCAKCRDVKKWSPAEDVNDDGVMWHWFIGGLPVEDVERGITTALAAKCNKSSSTRGRSYK